MLHPPSTASIPPLQDSHDAFASKAAFDSSIDHAPDVRWVDFRVGFALFRADQRNKAGR